MTSLSPAAHRTGRTAIRARAAIRVDLGPQGLPRVSDLRSEVPIVLRLTATQRATATDQAAATVHLVGAAAGPLAGDDLRLDIAVGGGVRLLVRSVAAMVALPGWGPGPSRFAVSAEVADGGALEFAPEPTVVAAGADHASTIDVRLGATARLLLREEILLGRFGEAPGSFHGTLRVDVSGAGPAATPAPLLRQDLVLGPDVPGMRGPAHLGAARAVGSLLVAGPEQAGPAVDAGVADGAALLPLAGPGYLVSAIADDAVSLRRRLLAGPADPVWRRA